MPFYSPASHNVDNSFGFLVVSVADLLNDELDERLEEAVGLSLSQWRVLARLRHAGTMTAAELCAELRYDSGAMTRLLDKLAALQLVERQTSPQDRRANQLVLTKEGLAVCLTGLDSARSTLNLALAELKDEEAQRLIATLQTVKRTLLARRTPRRRQRPGHAGTVSEKKERP